MRLRYSLAWRTLPIVATAVMTITAGVAFAGTPVAQGWRTIARVSRPGHSVGLSSITAAGPGQAWAVGGTSTGLGGPPVVQRWVHGQWVQVKLPKPVLAGLGQSESLITVSASRPGNVWAFNSDAGWLHWNGSKWHSGQDIGPTAPDDVISVLAIGQDSAWVFGGDITAQVAPFAAVRVGATWKRTPVPGRGPVVAASAISAGDIWAVLGTGLNSELGPAPAGSLVRWHSHRWTTVSSFPKAMRNQWLGSVRAVSDRDVWVGGAVQNGRGGFTEAVGHWNGRRWSVTQLKAAATVGRFGVGSLAPDGSGGLWALGLCEARCSRNSTQDWRLWHESHGTWSAPTRPRLASQGNALLTLAGAGHSIWAAGVVDTTHGHFEGLIALRGPTPVIPMAEMAKS